MTLLLCSVVGPFLCGLVIEPVVLIHCFIEIKQYKRQGDPGDKVLVIVAMIVSGLTFLAIIVALAIFAVEIEKGLANRTLPLP